ncbi:hypothetical protein MCOR15_011983 [Pyricularia oryzae]|nr:hypothetical protein MCOR15_011983 [Pyricularia oryzae]
MSPQQAIKFQEEEARMIEDLYKPGERQSNPCCADASSHKGAASIVKHCAQFGQVNFDSAVLQEEQERELAPEIEQERQVERPRPAKPVTHKLDPVVVNFAKTGVLPAGSTSFKPAFKSLELLTAAKLISKLSEFPQDVLVTLDFASTVKLEATAKQDQYLRPVQWVLTSTGGADRTSVSCSTSSSSVLLRRRLYWPLSGKTPKPHCICMHHGQRLGLRALKIFASTPRLLFQPSGPCLGIWSSS